MFDLRAISSVAPIGDLVFGIIAMLVAITVANLAIIPKLFWLDSRSAKTLLAVTALGCIAAAATLAVQPPRLYFAVLIYVVAFMLAGVVVAWRSIGWLQATVRVVSGSACMLLALAVAHWVAYAPR